MRKLFYILLIINIFSLRLYPQITVFSDFEGGNVNILKIDALTNTIYFTPDIDQNNTLRCWYYFGVANVRNKKLHFVPSGYNNLAKAYMPAYSYDRKHWYRVISNNYNFEIKALHDTLYVAMGYPYLYSDLQNFLNKIKKSPFVQVKQLTKSEGGNIVPYIIIKNDNPEVRNYVLILARQHAFETLSNYVLEGFIDYIITSENLKQILNKFFIVIVPIVDVDNVIKGQSGRMQKPYDFNRDWSDTPHLNAVKKIEYLVDSLNKSYKLKIFFDWHSTYPSVDSNIFGFFNLYYFYQKQYHNLENFWNLVSKLSGFKVLPIYTKFQKNVFYADQYFYRMKDIDFSCTIEFDWNYIEKKQIWDIKNLRFLGKKIAQALIIYSHRW